MNERTNELLVEINHKLGVVIALLANPLQAGESTLSLREQIRILNQYGLQSSEIAAILNKTTNYVSKELTLFRRDKK